MGKSIDKYIDIKESIFSVPQNSITLQLFNYPASISDGTITGVASVSSTGNVIVGELQSHRRGRYLFKNVVSGRYYTVIASGSGVTTFIPEGFEKMPVGQAPDVTGSDIPWKDNSGDSLQTKIESLGSFSTADGTTGYILRYKLGGGVEESAVRDDGTTVTFYREVKFGKPNYDTVTSLDATTASTILDLSLSNIFHVTIKNSTNISVLNKKVGTGYLFILEQDNVGNRTVTFSSDFNWSGGLAPTITQTASKKDVISGLCTGVNEIICDITQNH